MYGKARWSKHSFTVINLLTMWPLYPFQVAVTAQTCRRRHFLIFYNKIYMFYICMTDFGNLYVNIPIWLLFKINETLIFLMSVQIKQLCFTIC